MGDKQLEGKVAIVTGSSRGIGEDIARSLARDGASVVVAARSEEVTDKRLPGTIYSVATSIEDEGGRALPVVTNMRDPESIAGCVARTIEEFGRLNIVVNNAGVVVPGDIETVQERHLDLLWQIDVRGPVLMCKAAVPHLKAAGGGHVVNVTGSAANFPGPAPYSESDPYLFIGTAKAALERFTQGLAMQLQDDNIACNALSLGYEIRTPGSLLAESDPEHPRLDFGSAEWMGRAAVWICRQPPEYSGHIVFDDAIRYWLEGIA